MAFLGLVLAIVALILCVIFVKFLFTNFIISRILSIGTSLWAINIGTKIMEQGFQDLWIMSTVITTISWLFCVGPRIFDVEYDGTYNYDDRTGDITPNITGGFIGNAIVSLILCGAIYLLLGSEYLDTFYALPGFIIFLNLVAIFRRIRD